MIFEMDDTTGQKKLIQSIEAETATKIRLLEFGQVKHTFLLRKKEETTGTGLK
jgi:hypothetical protein